MSDQTQMTVRLSKDLRARLDAVAKADDRSVHPVIKRAIEAHVDHAEHEARELAILKERWARFEETGSYVPGDKVRAWVAGLRRERDDVA